MRCNKDEVFIRPFDMDYYRRKYEDRTQRSDDHEDLNSKLLKEIEEKYHELLIKDLFNDFHGE